MNTQLTMAIATATAKPNTTGRAEAITNLAALPNLVLLNLNGAN